MTSKEALLRAIELAGGQSALARLLRKRNGNGHLSPQAVQDWVRRGAVPADRILEIERVVGARVTRHELDPDLYPVENAEAA